MMKPTLSRSSELYKFVFGKQTNYQMDGHPEPLTDQISLGLFIGLFLFMVIMRPVGFIMITFLKVALYFVCFLVDGSYIRGKFPTEMRLARIEPWPTLFGHRFPPWTLIVALVTSYQYYTLGILAALEVTAYFALIIIIFRSIKPGDSSVSMELAEAIEPAVNKKLQLKYYRKPRLFPILHLTD